MRNFFISHRSYLGLSAILLYILPIALITGPFLSDLLLIIFSILVSLIIIKEKKYYYFKNKWVLLFLFFYLYLVLRSLLSDNPLLSLESSLFYFRYLLFTISIIYVVRNHLGFAENFLIFLFFTINILIIDSYIQFFFHYNLLGWPYNGQRITSLFGDDQVLGQYLLRMMPLYFGVLAMSSYYSRRGIIIALVMFFLTDVLIYLSGGRSVFFLLFLLTFLIILLIGKFKKERLTVFFLSILTISLITFFVPDVKYRMIDRTIQQIDVSSNNLRVVSNHHQLIYDTAIKMILDKPIIGHGPKMFRELCANEKYIINREIRVSNEISITNGCSTHPHNTYLQLLVETGIVGTVPVICLFFYLIYLAFRQIVSFVSLSEKYFLSDNSVVFMTVVIINLLPIVPSLNFFNNWINIIYFLPLALLLSSEKILKIKKL